MSSAYIVPASGEPQGWRYGSGTAIFTERFVDGRLLFGSLQDNGIPVYARDEHRDQPSFDLVADGESLAFGWEVASFEAVDSPGGTARAILRLRHSRLPVEVDVRTSVFGGGIIRRGLAMRNTSRDRALSITTVRPLAGVAWEAGDALRENLRDGMLVPYSAGFFKEADWGTEGRFSWHDVPMGCELSVGSRTGKSGHGAPFFVLRNNLFGGWIVCHLAWSGTWRAAFSAEPSVNQGRARLRFSIEPAGIPPLRVLEPGETVETPEVHLGASRGTFDEAVQAMHAYLREHVLDGAALGRPRRAQPVIYNHWGFMEHELSEERLLAEVDIAASVGAELFMVDAGWFGNTGSNWYLTTGDWRAGDRLPRDLDPVFDHARSHGLKVGLWVEAESAASGSRVAAEHPDWFIARYGKTVERILDLAKPAVAAHVEAELVRLVERYRLDMLRLDHNVYPAEGGFNAVHGREENSLWRSVQAIHGIIDSVRARFPDLLWENCAGGGGRTDLGMMARSTTTWVSDWMRMPRTVRILNGMSIALPPEYVDRLFGATMEGAYRGDAETQLAVAILAHPTISGITPTVAEANPALVDLVRTYLGIYKDFVRPFHRQALVYHHTPEMEGIDGRGYCVLEYAAPDRSRALAAVFRLVDAPGEGVPLRFRGIDPARPYRVTERPGGDPWTADGGELARRGIEVRIETPMSSRLYLLEALPR